jgi:hypothetical protein
MKDSGEYIAVSIAENKESDDPEPDGLMVDGPTDRGDDDDGLSFVTANSGAVPVIVLSTENDRYQYWFRRTLFPDDVVKVFNIIFAEGPFAIKFFKFTIFTFVGIWTMFYFVRFMVRTFCTKTLASVSVWKKDHKTNVWMTFTRLCLPVTTRNGSTTRHCDWVMSGDTKAI